MGGIELAWIAMERFPHIDVIVTSEQAIEDVPDNALFMQKPWLPLAAKFQAAHGALIQDFMIEDSLGK